MRPCEARLRAHYDKAEVGGSGMVGFSHNAVIKGHAVAAIIGFHYRKTSAGFVCDVGVATIVLRRNEHKVAPRSVVRRNYRLRPCRLLEPVHLAPG